MTTREKSCGPDFYVVLGVDPCPRSSWQVWREGDRYPNLIIELLSKSTAQVDRVTKKDLYQNVFKTPEYFMFHPKTLEFTGFRLEGGVYQPIPLTEQGWRWSEQLGVYLGIYQRQLRFFSVEGQLIPTPEERAEQEQQRANQAEQVAERLRQRLRALGLDESDLI